MIGEGANSVKDPRDDRLRGPICCVGLHAAAAVLREFQACPDDVRYRVRVAVGGVGEP
jgi:hypothetical protein